MYVSVVWTRAVCPKRPQVRANVQRDEVSGCGEVPSVGANLDGECGAVGKVENHGLRGWHSRRDSTSPYSMAATVLPTASRIVCSLSSGLGGPIILGCSPLLACWLSIPAPSASC